MKCEPVTILFLAYFLETRTKLMDDWKHTLLPAVAPSLVMAALIAMQPDLGTAIAIVMITLSVLFVAGMALKYYAYPLAAAPVIFYFLVWRVPGGISAFWRSWIHSQTRWGVDFTSSSR